MADAEMYAPELAAKLTEAEAHITLLVEALAKIERRSRTVGNGYSSGLIAANVLATPAIAERVAELAALRHEIDAQRENIEYYQSGQQLLIDIFIAGKDAGLWLDDKSLLPDGIVAIGRELERLRRIEAAAKAARVWGWSSILCLKDLNAALDAEPT